MQVGDDELLMFHKPDLIMVIPSSSDAAPTPSAQDHAPARKTVQGLRKSFAEDIAQLRRLAR